MAENKRPAIRFKGFIEEWEEHKLSNIATMKARIGWQGLTQKEFLNEGDYYLITGTDFENGQINFTNCHFISKDRYEQDTNIQVKNGDVLITKDGTIGKVAYIRGLEKAATLNAGVFVIKGNDKNVSNLYLYHYLAAPFLLDYANKQATGGTIKHLNQNVLVNFQIPLPKVKEQEKIGEFYQNIDNLITFYKSKYDKLQKVKKSMLEKMFPQNGSNVPEIRFKGFTEDWEQQKLGETVEIIMGQSPDGSTYSDIPSDYILVQGNGDLQDGWVKPRIWTTQVTKKAEDGDLIMSVRAPAGAIGKTAYSVVIGRGVAAIKGNEFIYQSLVKMNDNGYWKKLSCGSTFESLNSDNICNAEIQVPKKDEQRKIGAFFCNLDHLITLHKHKLEKLQTIKKSCLEKMFI